jgi:hypothetical protein
MELFGKDWPFLLPFADGESQIVNTFNVQLCQEYA